MQLKLMGPEYAELARFFEVNSEQCKNPDHYNNYIRIDWGADYKQGMGTTFVLIDDETEPEKIAAYITFRNNSLISDSGEEFKNCHPAIEIAELAVDKDYKGRGCGTDLIHLAITLSHYLSEHVSGVQYLIVCADETAVEFYKKFEFKNMGEIEDIPREYRNKNCVPLSLRIGEY